MLPEAWKAHLNPYLDGENFTALIEKVDSAYREEPVFPPREDLFSAFALTPPSAVRAVILGQDPYHEPGQAQGLAFSVRKGVPLPPSLRNIFHELETDLGVSAPASGDLTFWAQQGVLLLNTALTVRCGEAASHKDLGWQDFTDAVIASLQSLPHPISFVLWGAHAAKKRPLAEASPYPRLVLQTPHPSPLSAYRGFFGSRPFSQINRFLTAHGQNPIRWGD